MTDAPRYVRVDRIGIVPVVTEEMLQQASDLIDRHAEEQRERALGVDPGRVIDGETVQPVRKEIAGG